MGSVRFLALAILILSFQNANANNANCSDLSPEAKQNMQSWLNKCGSKLANNGAGKVAIVDMGGSEPKLFLLDKQTLSCSLAVPVEIGKNSVGRPPKAGNEAESNMTPAGFHITRLHQGERYGPNNSLAMDGTGSENNNSLSRAILLHAKQPGVNTIGCIGVPPEHLNTVMNELGTGSVIYNHFPNEKGGDSQNNCDGKGAGAPTNRNYHGGPGQSQEGSRTRGRN
ncbi:MAG: murein L,D-transpeptidase catalytic domain family protein [Bdellovibrionaceae bacterium]|nr:murein L,D-transpeptidase catalytic domain family protein [Pseudobdellovibrionaceae bacterium]